MIWAASGQRQSSPQGRFHFFWGKWSQEVRGEKEQELLGGSRSIVEHTESAGVDRRPL